LMNVRVSSADKRVVFFFGTYLGDGWARGEDGDGL
jgi:hypothetical protein